MTTKMELEMKQAAKRLADVEAKIVDIAGGSAFSAKLDTREVGDYGWETSELRLTVTGTKRMVTVQTEGPGCYLVHVRSLDGYRLAENSFQGVPVEAVAAFIAALIPVVETIR